MSKNRREEIQRVKRTEKLMKAGKLLRKYRDRLDDIIKVITSGTDFHSDIANDVVNMGIEMQGLSKILRPLSVEGQAKKKERNIIRRWRRHVEKNRASMTPEDFKKWVSKYCEKYSWASARFRGPTQAFYDDYVDKTEKGK